MFNTKKFKMKKPNKMIKKSVEGILSHEIYVSIGRSYKFIEAICTSIYHPDYAYKRFPCTLEGYQEAYDWVLKTSSEMAMNRVFTVGIHSVSADWRKDSKYPRCFDWTNDTVKSEPCQLSIELDLEKERK